MKITQSTPGNLTTDETKTEPKLRNIHDDKGVIEEDRPAGADIRLKLGAAVLFVLVVFTIINGSLAKTSLSKQLKEQEDLLTTAQAEALLYNIIEDEDGNLELPELQEPVDVAEVDWDSITTRNTELINSFAACLLNWEDTEEYNEKRETLLTDWQFTEDSRLMTYFMTKLEDGQDAGSLRSVGSQSNFFWRTMARISPTSSSVKFVGL